MADNVQLASGVGGAVAAADDIGGVHHQRVKLSVGADGSASDAIPVSNGLDTTAAGVQAVGIVGQLDDASTGTVTENQFAPVRISSRRALLVEGVASGTAQPVSIAATVTVDGSGVTQPVSHAALTELAAAIDTEVQVDVVGALPAGTNNIGDVDIASALPAGNNNIGDVDVASLPSSTLAGGAKQELDYDTGAGTQTTQIIGIALPASGGPVAGGTSTNPLQVGDAGGSLTIDGTVTANLSATDNAVLDSIDAAVNGTLDVNIVSGAGSGGTAAADDADFTAGTTSGTPAMGVYESTPTNVTDGDLGTVGITQGRRLKTSATIDAALPAGSNAIGTVTAVGGVAHDAADSGNPIKIGGRADTTFQTAVADGDRVDALFDVYGQMRQRRDHVNLWSYHDDDAAAVTTDGTVQAAPGAGLSVYITDIVFSIGAATASSIFLEEGTSKILGPYYLEAIAGRSVHIRFDTPKKCTANTAILVTNTGSITFAIDITGFIAP